MVTTAAKLEHESQTKSEDEKMVTGGARPGRRWRRAKSKRQRQKAAKDLGQKSIQDAQSVYDETSDRLLLSALKYWEVERDLIEERLATMRSATAAS